MTCAHVLGLIDAGPLAGYPPSHFAAAWRHAETCPECGPAMAMAGEIVQGVSDWPDVAPPIDLAAVVMARLARVDEAREAETVETPARGRAAAWAGVATALGGLTACAALAWSAATGGASLVRLAGPGLGSVATSGATWPATLPEGALLAVSLGLYVVGLFAPVAEGSSSPR